MKRALSDFREVWFLDFEFQANSGDRQKPVCLVARELHSNRLIRQWLTGIDTPTIPFDTGPETLFVAYYASAEIGCFYSLGWECPIYILDLFTEFRTLTNGRHTIAGDGLLGAMTHFGLDTIDSAEKTEMRELAMRGGEYAEGEKNALLDYCQTDVDGLQKLYLKMQPYLDIPRSFLRGRYMKAAASMEYRGIPIDIDTLNRLKQNWELIKSKLVERIDPNGEVYEGTTFKTAKFSKYLLEHKIPWPTLATGKLDLKDATFRQLAIRYPEEVGKFRELRYSLGQLRLSELPVGRDDRNRCLLSAFRSTTGRNQPSNAKFIFGPSAWLRSLIKPEQGKAIAYIDWSQQEFGIAAAFSQDPKMADAYNSGDPYLAFAKQAGAVPGNATKASHKEERARFKACLLGTNYGMGPEALATSIGESTAVGRELLQLHRQTYPQYWKWNEAVVNRALLSKQLHSVFGWRLQVPHDANTRSLANFPCQSNGSEMLRLACCMMVESGIRLLCPVHDAVLIESDVDQIEDQVAQAQKIMKEASSIILDGFELETDAEIVRYPDRYQDERGLVMWNCVMGILNEIENGS